jgi:hypothetical protein
MFNNQVRDIDEIARLFGIHHCRDLVQLYCCFHALEQETELSQQTWIISHTS